VLPADGYARPGQKVYRSYSAIDRAIRKIGLKNWQLKAYRSTHFAPVGLSFRDDDGVPYILVDVRTSNEPGVLLAYMQNIKTHKFGVMTISNTFQWFTAVELDDEYDSRTQKFDAWVYYVTNFARKRATAVCAPGRFTCGNGPP